MISRSFIIATVALLVAHGAAVAQLTPGVTKVVKYSASSMTATKHIQGHCWTSSIASRRSDAFRCMAGNEIYDPCFRIDPKAVACPDEAAFTTGVLMGLTQPLPPAQSPPPAPQAWAMVLQSGAHCNRATGTVDPDFPYYCSGERGQCSEPNLATVKQAYYVRCATKVSPDGKAENVTSTLVKIAYE